MNEQCLVERDADGYPVAILITDSFGDLVESIRPAGTRVA